ncbi:hypothetical protein LOTGIDRAFT_232824 [Lottia gigantea]|uniref:Uncharacterized protein n=1 Tax=Lottia gigantea TaxID=225164 RepID=V4AI36_LOTGI|nr:hypothetical protein LOTGIDRAFT_232824 [Lottia gigantea]ESO93076.1 hypothetical protein LOTGIDRAFT_232824 [Lottia gigantea]
MSSAVEQTDKSHTSSSQTGASSAKNGQSTRRRRTRMVNEKKIADDEFMAAAIGDVEWLKQSLKDSGSISNFDKNGLTAFHLAAIHGRLDCLKLCVEKFKFDINQASSTGWRPVHLVISNQTGKRALQCLKYLLEKGANPSVTNDDLITPVHQSASEGHVQCLKLLIENGACVNSKDCRGNTPLDLSKLWSHRKCGRILAAEIWHQEKDHVAMEMNQLQKVKMQQVLKDLEEEEERHTSQEFYGQQAFKDWLASRNLEERPTGPTGRKTEMDYNYDESARETNSPDKHPLMKPNSKAPPRSNSQLRTPTSREPTQSPGKEKTSMSLKRDPTYNTEYTFEFEEDDDENFDGQGNKPQVAGSPEKRTKSKLILAKHDSPWTLTTATNVPKPEYLPHLKDEYPRDEFTLMPKTKPEQKYYDGKHAGPKELKKEKSASAKARAIDLPKDVQDKVLSRDPSILERPILFKPKHVIDLPTKKKLEEEVKPRDEVSLHLCSDVSSILFKNSLKMKPPSSAKSSSSGLSKATDWTSEDFPSAMVAQAMKQMAKSNYFPKTSGSGIKI